MKYIKSMIVMFYLIGVIMYFTGCGNMIDNEHTINDQNQIETETTNIMTANINVDEWPVFTMPYDYFTDLISYTTDYMIYASDVNEVNVTMKLLIEEPRHLIIHGFYYDIIKKGTYDWHYVPTGFRGLILLPMTTAFERPFVQRITSEDLMHGFLPGTYRIIKEVGVAHVSPDENRPEDRIPVWEGIIWAEFEIAEPE
ncbi:MAG: hypothetical protein FWE90_03700 [Defluviitaleaceae bacterium]|nr:hypothetical protein [Defluviitaleaceae bacterium]